MSILTLENISMLIAFSIFGYYADNILTFKSMLESITAGHFPPSSRVTGVRCFAAAAITMRATFALPEEITMALIVSKK